MAQAGLVEAQGNAWLDTLRGIPFVAAVTTVDLYDDPPGADAEDNAVTVIADRSAVIFDAPDGASMDMTGDPPSFDITGAATLKYAGLWTGFRGDGTAVATGVLTQPVTVADGDTVKFGSLTVEFESSGLAAD